MTALFAYLMILAVLVFFAGLVAAAGTALGIAVFSLRVRQLRGAVGALGLSICPWIALLILQRIARLPGSDPWHRFYDWVGVCCIASSAVVAIRLGVVAWRTAKRGMQAKEPLSRKADTAPVKTHP